MALSKMRLLDAVGRWTVPNLKQFQHSRQPVVWLLAPFIGLAAGGAAILFRLGIGVFQLPWLGTMSESVTAAASVQPWWVILLAPAVAGLLVGLMLQYLLAAKRTGAVPDVMEARINAGRDLDLRQGLVSTLASALSLGGGASAGREGPIVYFGATIAAATCNRLNLPNAAPAHAACCRRRRRRCRLLQCADCRRPVRPGGGPRPFRRDQLRAPGACLGDGDHRVAGLVRQYCRLRRSRLPDQLISRSTGVCAARHRRRRGGDHFPDRSRRHRLDCPQHRHAAHRPSCGRRPSDRRHRALVSRGPWRRLRQHRRGAEGSIADRHDVGAARRQDRGDRDRARLSLRRRGVFAGAVSRGHDRRRIRPDCRNCVSADGLERGPLRDPRHGRG